jgi:hypothetical protein
VHQSRRAGEQESASVVPTSREQRCSAGRGPARRYVLCAEYVLSPRPMLTYTDLSICKVPISIRYRTYRRTPAPRSSGPCVRAEEPSRGGAVSLSPAAAHAAVFSRPERGRRVDPFDY